MSGFMSLPEIIGRVRSPEMTHFIAEDGILVSPKFSGVYEGGRAQSGGRAPRGQSSGARSPPVPGRADRGRITGRVALGARWRKSCWSA